MAVRSSVRRYLPPVVVFAGLALFAFSLLFLATAGSGQETTLNPSYLEVVNDTAFLVYSVDDDYGAVYVNYTFPQAPGDVMFVSCEDTRAVRAGGNATNPFLAFRRTAEGSMVVSSQTLGDTYYDYRRARSASPSADRCYYPAVLFTWAAPDGDPVANRPNATVRLVPEELNPEDALLSLVASVAGATFILIGGMTWARDRAQPTQPDPDEGTAESLRHSLDQMAAQLERTRRHLLLAGILGIFLWYPLLVPWVYATAQDATTIPWIPWALAAGALIFLASLTTLWARELVVLDRALAKWRARLAELRKREDQLLDALEGR